MEVQAMISPIGQHVGNLILAVCAALMLIETAKLLLGY